MQDAFSAAMLAAIVLFSGFAGMAAAYDGAASETDDVTVTVDVVHEHPIDLPGTEVRDEQLTLNDTNLTRGDDYRLDERRGHVYFDADGATDESDTVTAEYTADVPTDFAEHIRGPVGTVIVVAAGSVLVLFVAIVLGGVGSLKRRAG